jgi:hypothetical protein
MENLELDCVGRCVIGVFCLMMHDFAIAAVGALDMLDAGLQIGSAYHVALTGSSGPPGNSGGNDAVI